MKIDQETKDLIIELSQGNPGAINVMMQMSFFPEWREMLKWMKKNFVTGSKIWIMYKDDFGQDLIAMGQDIRASMKRQSF